MTVLSLAIAGTGFQRGHHILNEHNDKNFSAPNPKANLHVIALRYNTKVANVRLPSRLDVPSWFAARMVLEYEINEGDRQRRYYAGRGDVRLFCKLDEAGEILFLGDGTNDLSARGYLRVLKQARMIADLAGFVKIQAAHLAEALKYRPTTMMG